MSTSAVDNEAVATGWFALPTSTNQAFLLVEHQTLGVDERGVLTETSREAAHACRVRHDRGLLRIETVRGEVSINGRRVSKRALLSDSGVLRLGGEAFFLSERALAAEPVEVVNELPGIWQPFMEEMQIDEIEAIPEPAAAPMAGPKPEAGETDPKPDQAQSDRAGAARDMALHTAPITVAEPAVEQRRTRSRAGRPAEPAATHKATRKAPSGRKVPVVALFALAATLVFTALLLWQTQPPSTASNDSMPPPGSSELGSARAA